MPTTLRPTPTLPYPVSISFVIEADVCCQGGAAGEAIELTARCEAQSPFGEVTHMRVWTSSSPLSVEQLKSSSAWEPFVISRTFTVPVAINWTVFYVNVQFRDSVGKLSPAVWDDISIDGQSAHTP